MKKPHTAPENDTENTSMTQTKPLARWQSDRLGLRKHCFGIPGMYEHTGSCGTVCMAETRLRGGRSAATAVLNACLSRRPEKCGKSYRRSWRHEITPHNINMRL